VKSGFFDSYILNMRLTTSALQVQRAAASLDREQNLSHNLTLVVSGIHFRLDMV
jgi:hypothetical protein